MFEIQRMRVYQEFNRQNDLLLSSLRGVLTCKTQLQVFYNRLDYPHLTQTFLHDDPQDVFTPVMEPMNKIRDMVTRMKSAKTISAMDGIINEWVETRDALLESVDQSASWQWGKAVEFKFTGIKTVDHQHVETHVQFQQAGKFLRHWIDKIEAPLKDVVLIALQGERQQPVRYATIMNRLN